MLTKLLFKRKKTGSDANPKLDKGEPLYDEGSAHFYVGDGTNELSNLNYVGKIAERLGTQTVGSAEQPIYIENGVPVAGQLYGGGTRVSVNGLIRLDHQASIYAPTKAGNEGDIPMYFPNDMRDKCKWVSPSTLTINASQIDGVITSAQLPSLYCGNISVTSSASGQLYVGNLAVSTISTTTASPTFSSITASDLNGFHFITDNTLGSGMIKSSGTGANSHTESLTLFKDVRVSFNCTQSGGVTSNKISIGTGSITAISYELREIQDNNEATALTSSGTNVVTERSVYYALPSINGVHNYTSNSSIYAPTNSGEEGQVLFAKGPYVPPAWEDGREKTFEEIVTHDPADPVTEVTTTATLREGIYLCEVRLYGTLSTLTSIVEVSNSSTYLLTQVIGSIGASLVSFSRESATMNIDSKYRIVSGSEIEYVILYKLKTL